ncbi:MAG: hypothetical protein Q7R81_01975 [Candidatus Peregrinibacteria bacterium]|nr:hypothetical protein [Candidatus Peregrinibacteria bacterium]
MERSPSATASPETLVRADLKEALRASSAATVGTVQEDARAKVQQRIRTGEILTDAPEIESDAEVTQTGPLTHAHAEEGNREEKFEAALAKVSAELEKMTQGTEHLHTEKLADEIKGQAEPGAGERGITANQNDLPDLIGPNNKKAKEGYELMIAHEEKHADEVTLTGEVKIDEKDTLKPFDGSEGRAETGSQVGVGNAASTRREGMPEEYEQAQRKYLRLQKLVGEETVEKAMTSGNGSPQYLQSEVLKARVKKGEINRFEALIEAQESGMDEEGLAEVIGKK